VSAAAELLGDFRDIHLGAAAKTDFDLAIALFNGDERGLGAVDFQALVDEIFRIGRMGAELGEIGPGQLGISQLSLAVEQNSIQGSSGEMQPRRTGPFIELAKNFMRSGS